jgi:hypothetical protein
MKKIFILSFLLALSVSLMAQTSGTTYTLPWNVAEKTVTLTSVDSITQHVTAYWVFNINRAKPQYFAVSVALDTIGAVPCGKTNWLIKGSMDGTNYVTCSGVTGVNPGGTTAGLVQDTTFYLGDVSTGVLWKYLKVQAVSSSTLHIKGVRVKGLALKICDK